MVGCPFFREMSDEERWDLSRTMSGDEQRALVELLSFTHSVDEHLAEVRRKHKAGKALSQTDVELLFDLVDGKRSRARQRPKDHDAIETFAMAYHFERERAVHKSEKKARSIVAKKFGVGESTVRRAVEEEWPLLTSLLRSPDF